MNKNEFAETKSSMDYYFIFISMMNRISVSSNDWYPYQSRTFHVLVFRRYLIDSNRYPLRTSEWSVMICFCATFIEGKSRLNPVNLCKYLRRFWIIFGIQMLRSYYSSIRSMKQAILNEMIHSFLFTWHITWSTAPVLVAVEWIHCTSSHGSKSTSSITLKAIVLEILYITI